VLDLPDEARAALEDNHTPSYVVQATYGGALTEESVPVDPSGTLKFTAGQDIQASGNMFLRRDGARALVPREMTDSLAPFGQELNIFREVKLGESTWRIPMGPFRIEEVPDMREYFRRYPEQLKLVGWEAELRLVDRFDIIIADDFLQPTSPKVGNSTWDEIQRLSSIPILRSLTDAPVPPGLTYDSRMEAITSLMSNIGGVPHLTRQGVLTARVKDAWLTSTTPVFTIRGTTDLGDSMSNQIYNAVVASSSAGSNELVAFAEITDPTNPLSVNGPLRRRTFKHSSPLYETQAAVQAAARTVLARVSSKQARTVKVRCLPRPDLELGDYGTVVDENAGRQVTGEISDMSFSMDPTAEMTLEMILSHIEETP
jgi:hypothetical protein